MKNFLIQIKIFCVTDHMHTQYNVVILLMIVDECCINLVNVVTVLNILLITVVYDLQSYYV